MGCRASYRADLDRCALAAGVQLIAQAEIDGVRLITSLAFDGVGVAIVPATSVMANQTGPWSSVPVVGFPPRSVGVVQRRRGMLPAPARAMMEVLRSVLAYEGPRQPGVTLSPDL
jgi:DNA-binding transcriptional LysR family regulator